MRPNQYIGLESVERPSSPASRWILNYPQLLAQVNISNPSQVLADESRNWQASRGSIDSKVLVTLDVGEMRRFWGAFAECSHLDLDYCTIPHN